MFSLLVQNSIMHVKLPTKDNIFIPACSMTPNLYKHTFGENRLLSGKLFQHFGCSGQPVTRFTNTDIETKFADA